MAARRLLATALVLGGILTLASPRSSSALSCSEWPLDQALRDAEIVFIGTQLDPSLEGSDQEHVIAEFSVESVIQGDLPGRIDMVLDPWAGPTRADSAGREVVFAYTGSDGVIRQDAGCAPPATPSGVERMLEHVPVIESSAPAAVLLIGDLGWADVATLDRDGLITGLAYLPELRGGAVVCEGSALAFTGNETIDLRTLEIVATYPDIRGAVWCSGTDATQLEVIAMRAGPSHGWDQPVVTHHVGGRSTVGAFAHEPGRRQRAEWTVSRSGDVATMWPSTSAEPATIEVLRRGAESTGAKILFGDEHVRHAAIDPSGERLAVTMASVDYRDEQADEIAMIEIGTANVTARITLLDGSGAPNEVLNPVETMYPSYPLFGERYAWFSPPMWIDESHVGVVRFIEDERHLDIYDTATGDRTSSTLLEDGTDLLMHPHAEVPATRLGVFLDGELTVIAMPDDFSGGVDPILDGPVVRASAELHVPTLREPLPLPSTTTTTQGLAEPEAHDEPEATAEAPVDPQPSPDAGGRSLLVVGLVGFVAAGAGFWWSFRRSRTHP